MREEDDSAKSEEPGILETRSVSRRQFLKIAGIAGAAVGMGAGLGGLLAACGGTEETTTTGATTATTSGAKPTVKIVELNELAGDQADLQGKQTFGGMDLAIKDVNDAGGILGGRMIEGIKVHEGYTSEEVINGVKEAVSKKPACIIGFNEAGTTDAALPTAKEANIPCAVCYACSLKVIDPTFWDIGFLFATYPDQAENPARVLTETNGWKTAGHMTIDGSYGQLSMGTFERWWPEGNGKVNLVEKVFYTYGSTDISPEVTKLVSKSPEVVIFGMWGEALIGAALKKLKELNYKGAIIFDIGAITQSLIDNLGDITEGTRMCYVWLPDDSIEVNKTWNKHFTDVNGWTPNDMASNSYTATRAFCAAMDKAGTDTDAKAIAEAMMGVNFVTPWGKPMEMLPHHQFHFPYSGIGQVQKAKFVVEMNAELPASAFVNPTTGKPW